ncbi:hypothetical protein CN223_25215 [Sinorhizobium meliloti]|uniref:Imm45 family immunity protein n=1 Tax=Rhizobium meliloti TaxID=382 RepID=UPI000FD741E9|nr:Imm45 family immunity protein [Sinorhizobium meliloti]RVG73601.1 hypothetical protein CN223_25215 [Sinorhizobium meliloti]
MQKLVDLEEPQIWRGAIFRVKGSHPYEELVDFMVVETTDAARPLGIMVATGYSAGHTIVHLPPEAIVLRTKSISTAWLKANWSKWVYECPVHEVLFMRNYAASIGAAATALTASELSFTSIDLSSDFYAEPSGDGTFVHGRVYHIARNADGGSLSTPVARFYVTQPRLPVEGYHEHMRLDCFVNDRKLVPEPDRLAQLLLHALVRQQAISEPLWLSWHYSEELAGQNYGDVFDFD